MTKIINLVFCMILVIICSHTGIAQNNNTSSFSSGSKELTVNNPDVFSNFQADLNKFLFDVSLSNRYETISTFYAKASGTPYLFREYQPGRIILNNGQVLHNVKLNFDGYEGTFVAINEQDEKILLNPEFLKEVVIGDGPRALTFKKSNPQNEHKFYQVLYDQEMLTFYKEIKITLKEASNNGILEIPAEFRQRTNYYVVKGDLDPISVNLKKQDLFNYFPEIERIAVNEILKKKKIKLRNEADYIALLANL